MSAAVATPATPADVVRARRNELRSQLAGGEANLARVLRETPEWLGSVPVGDLLTWCPGLTDGLVVAVLDRCSLNWGRPIRRLTDRERTLILRMIRERWPEIWRSWAELARGAAV